MAGDSGKDANFCRLDEITDLISSMQPSPSREEIQGYLRVLQEQMMSRLVILHPQTVPPLTAL